MHIDYRRCVCRVMVPHQSPSVSASRGLVGEQNRAMSVMSVVKLKIAVRWLCNGVMGINLI